MSASQNRPAQPISHAPLSQLVAILDRSYRLRDEARESIDHALRLRAQTHQHCMEDLWVIAQDRREMSLRLAGRKAATRLPTQE